MASGKTALIVGASRGLGLALAREYLGRGWRVVATQRSGSEALAALEREHAGRLRLETLDVTDERGAVRLAAALGDTTLDLLFVSAGITNDNSVPAGTVSPAVFARILETNAHAPLRLVEMLGPRVAAEGTIVAMSSVLGSVGENGSGGYEVYRASKAALNTLLRCYAARHPERTVIAMHPGWVRTDMGGAEAPLGVADSARGMADVITAHGGRRGCAFLDHAGRTIPW